MLIQLVRADGLDEVLNGRLDLLILRLELLGLLADPSLLHLDEVVKGECLGILGKVD